MIQLVPQGVEACNALVEAFTPFIREAIPVGRTGGSGLRQCVEGFFDFRQGNSDTLGDFDQ